MQEYNPAAASDAVEKSPASHDPQAVVVRLKKEPASHDVGTHTELSLKGYQPLEHE